MREILIVKNKAPAVVDPGPAPMLQWLRIDRLVIDDSYQRSLKGENWKAINRIASRFKWSRFSPVFCAPIEGGRFAIIDGQHRVHAAALCGFEEVPCQIVQMSTTEQAESFAAVNGAVTKVTSVQLFKAALKAGDPWAVEADKVALDAGCRLMTSNASDRVKQPGQIFSPHAFRKVIDQHGAERITAALKLIKSAEGYSDNRDLWDAGPLTALLTALAGDPGFLDRTDARQILEDFDIWAAIEDAEKEYGRRRRLDLPRINKHDLLAKAVAEGIAKGGDE
ncbi:ParB N-terminal domain-containing protein [Rhizobium sp. 0TCS1.26]|uniref:ParB N-terminal domain-containing protein n=1 Tax=Rhizobium sp. 0TCS1.26 TaxID=3142623 RepID=UPI003D2AEFB9